MTCGVLWKQIQEIERALGTVQRAGFGPGTDVYNVLWGQRGKLFGQLGFKAPRSIIDIIKIIGLSPGTITLFEDVEAGWLTMARKTPESPPVYHYVDDDIATAILKKELTKELEQLLMEPDPYIGT